MTATKATDLTALALALASAKKPCPEPCVNGITAFIPGRGGEGFTKCETCEGTGEVYVLDSSVRVECSKCQGFGWYNSSRGQGRLDCGFFGCQGRGWNPLDPRFLGDWMVALAKVVTDPIRLEQLNSKWWCIWATLYDTPGEAFFLTATKALNLPTETE